MMEELWCFDKRATVSQPVPRGSSCEGNRISSGRIYPFQLSYMSRFLDLENPNRKGGISKIITKRIIL